MYLILFYIAGSACLVYICICGPTQFHRDGVVGWLHTVVTSAPSQAVKLFFTALCCSRRKGARFGRLTEHYLCERRNPIIQMLYVLLTGIAVWVWYANVFPGIPADSVHTITAPLCTVLCLSTFVIACAADPGTITADNVEQHLALYPYDNFLYTQPGDCRTCVVPRPARSKHCRVCNKCIAKFDHHCVWLNADVGLNNHRYFMLFLVAHVALCAYGSALCLWVLGQVIVRQRLFHTRYMLADGTAVAASPYVVCMYLVQKYILIVGVLLFMATLGLMMFVFFGYHAYLISMNITSNESYKWADSQEEAEERGESLSGRYHAYDRGLWANWKEVLWPPTPRPGPRTPAAAPAEPPPAAPAPAKDKRA